jgi:hypothetical protein
MPQLGQPLFCANSARRSPSRHRIRANAGAPCAPCRFLTLPSASSPRRFVTPRRIDLALGSREFVPATLPDWGSNIEKFSTHALTALGTSVEVFGGLIVFFFVGVYGALEPNSHARILLCCMPTAKKSRVRRVLSVSTGNYSTGCSVQEWRKNE